MAWLLKYLPLIAFALQVPMVWVAWSLRQLAKTEVGKVVSEAEARLSAKDDAMDHRLDSHGDRLLQAESKIGELTTDIGNLPTKADMARIEGEVKAVGREVGATNAGVARLEGYFLKRGVDGVAG